LTLFDPVLNCSLGPRRSRPCWLVRGNWKLFAQFAVTGIVTELGWWAVNYFSKRRDIENDRRKLRIEYLLDAYRRLDSASHRDGRQSEFEGRLESAVADIQLLGSPKQAALAAQFCMDMATNKIAYMDDLLRDFRDSLRSELKLKRIPVILKHNQHG
jgi:hypothetical protein